MLQNGGVSKIEGGNNNSKLEELQQKREELLAILDSDTFASATDNDGGCCMTVEQMERMRDIRELLVFID